MYNRGIDHWRQLDSMERGRNHHSCGLVPYSDGSGKDIVVAGGVSEEPYTTVEIFSVETESWRRGKG